MYDLHLIQQFESVYRLRSFTKAADELGSTESMVKKGLKTLETYWKTQLFYNMTHSVTPTDAGERLYPLAVQLLKLAETTRQDVVGREKDLKIVCGPVILESLLKPATALFRETYPHTRISQETKAPEAAIEDVIHKRADVSFYHSAAIEGLSQAEVLSVSNLICDAFHVICRPDHPVTEGKQGQEEILSYDWAMVGFDDLFEANLSLDTRTLLKLHDFPLYRPNTVQTCLDLVQTTDVLGTVPTRIAKPLIDSGVVDGFSHFVLLQFSIDAVTLRDALIDPTTAHFISCVKKAYANR